MSIFLKKTFSQITIYMYPSKVYSLFVGIAPSSHLCDLCNKQKSAYGRNTEADNKRFYLLLY